MNDRYELYLRTKPEEVSNLGYMFWIQQRWREWGKLNGSTSDFRSPADHEAFDLWLVDWVAGVGTA